LILPIGAGFFGIEHFTPPWDVFFLPLFNLLVGLYQFIFSDFALAIIIFTVVIRTLLAPLFVRQIRSQKEMQRMAPLIREVNRKHKGNRQKIAEETQALYREHGVNPAAGCLPVVAQLPLLLALYQALIRASNSVTLTPAVAASDAFTKLKAVLPGITDLGSNHFTAPISGPCNLPQLSGGDFTHFLPLNCQLIDPIKLSHAITTKVPWLLNLDLAKVDDRFALIIPGTGFALSALAVAAALLQFVQVRMTSPKPNPDDPTATTTNTMTYLFPLLTIWWGGLFPSGLILYWVVYTAYLIAQQFRIMGWGNLFPLFGWRPPFAGGANDELGVTAKRGDAPVGPPEAARKSGQPSTPRPAGSPGAARQGQRGNKKRRGRKR
jgi:YidC/Oxa1 family membrane protein insertase